VVNQELATLTPGYAPSTLQIKRSRSYQISGREGRPAGSYCPESVKRQEKLHPHRLSETKRWTLIDIKTFCGLLVGAERSSSPLTLNSTTISTACSGIFNYKSINMNVSTTTFSRIY
jgi:hypothetical protein